MSREDSVFKRCKASGCGRTIKSKEARCSKCGGRAFSWAFAIDVGSSDARRQERKSGFATREEAPKDLTRVRASILGGTYAPSRKLTVGQYRVASDTQERAAPRDLRRVRTRHPEIHRADHRCDPGPGPPRDPRPPAVRASLRNRARSRRRTEREVDPQHARHAPEGAGRCGR